MKRDKGELGMWIRILNTQTGLRMTRSLNDENDMTGCVRYRRLVGPPNTILSKVTHFGTDIANDLPRINAVYPLIHWAYNAVPSLQNKTHGLYFYNFIY